MTELTFEETKKLFFRNLANIVTILGIIGAVWLFIIILAYPEELWLIIILSVFIGLTDFIDGRVARSLKIESSLGSALDRIRDKLFIPPILVFLVWHYWPAEDHSVVLTTLTAALVVCSVAIEIVLFAGWVFGLLTKKSVQSNRYGRIKMFLQFCIVMVWLISLAIQEYAIGYSIYLINGLLAITIYYAVKSLEGYYLLYFRKEQKTQ